MSEEVEIEIDAEFITLLGDELRNRDESVSQFVSERCQARLNYEKGGWQED